MSKKNYTKYSENIEEKEVIVNEEVETEEVNEEEVETEEEVKTEEEVNEEEVNEEEHTGAIVPAVIVDCKKLNVRKEASKNAEVACVIAEGNEITVDVDKSTEDFYKVYAKCGEILVEGYCVKEFISIK